MKKTIEIEICDICQRENTHIILTCIVCGRGLCVLCEGIGYNPYNYRICKECIKRDDVQQIMEELRPSYERAYHNNRKKLENLGE